MKLRYNPKDNNRFPAFYMAGKKFLFLDRKHKSRSEYEHICTMFQKGSKFYIKPVIDIEYSYTERTLIAYEANELITCQELTREVFPEYFL